MPRSASTSVRLRSADTWRLNRENRRCRSVGSWSYGLLRGAPTPNSIRTRLECLVAVEQEGHGTVIDRGYLHQRAELPGLHLQSLLPQASAQALDEPPGRLRLHSPVEGGPTALPAVAIQRELAHHEHRATGVFHRSVHLPRFILKDSEFRHLRADVVCVGLRIALTGPDQNQEPRADGRYLFACYGYRRFADPLNDRPHAAHACKGPEVCSSTP